MGQLAPFNKTFFGRREDPREEIIVRLYPWPRRTLEFMIRKREKYNPDGMGQEFEPFFRTNAKSVSDLKQTKAQCYLSVVVPAMNEEERLPIMLDECLEYLNFRAESSQEFTYEIIVVDDGSRDKTADVAFGYSKRGFPVSVLKLKQNVGKGGAVRQGVQCSRGSLILFADADGATKFSDFAKLEEKANSYGKESLEDADFVIAASRAHLEEDSKATRSFLRTVLMIGFHWIVYIFAVRSIRDTQCGFKLFSRRSAAKRWAFDVELLYLAERLGIPLHEVAVEWHEVDGSKITPLYASYEMGRDILLIWLRYTFRIWHLQDLRV